VKFVSQHADAAPIPIDYYTWAAEQDGNTLFKLTQIPLKLAWAASVHKLQGCTLDMAEIDMARAFEFGQVYVALSRVRSKESLFIKSMDFDKIRCSEKALAFYRKVGSG
jgi:ATP-dependent DNA helicase PIF1